MVLARQDVRLLDWVCPADRPKSPAGEESVGPVYEIAVPYRGLFVKHLGRLTVIGDSNHLIPFGVDECFRMSHPNGGGDRATVLRLSPAALEEALEHINLDLRRLWLLPVFPMSPQVAVAAGRARVAALKAGTEPLAADESLVYLLSVLAHEMRNGKTGRLPPPAASLARHREQVLHVIALLSLRYSQRLTLAELAQGVGASPFHLCRIFRAETGRSIHSYLVRLRLNAGLERLLEGERNLSQLAHALGFSSHAHFTAAFRQAYGSVPSKVRSLFQAARLPGSTCRRASSFPLARGTSQYSDS